jgi:putative ABC transport system ATP-binding protein
MKSILKTDKLCKSFSTGGKQIHVIKNLDLEIEEGAFTVVMGRSGSGKSTLLYAISGMDKPTLGGIWFGGRNIAKLTNDELAVFRRENCGFVFQQIHLMDNMSVMDNVLTSGLLLTNNKKAITSRAEALFARVGLDRELWGNFPSQLSGGEAQRVGIVRALINSPPMLFADEPTGALNSSAGEAVLDVISGLHQSGQSVVLVTHDLKIAARGSRIIYLHDGSISGELELPPYAMGEARDDKAERIDKLQKFLDKMGW